MLGLISSLIGLQAPGAPGGAPPPLTSAAAVLAARADLRSIPPIHHPFIRYVFERDALKDRRLLRINNLTLNYASRGYFISKAVPLYGGQLLRVDTRVFDPDDKDWRRTWEELSTDPTFSLLLTKDLLTFNTEAFFAGLPLGGRTTWRTEEREIRHPGGPFKFPDDTGRVEESAEWVKPWRGTVELRFRVQEPATRKTLLARFDAEKIDVIRANAPDVDSVAFTDLQRLTASVAPIVSAPYLRYRMLSSIVEDGLYQQVFGGLFYKFKGIKKSKDKDTTDLDLFLENLGIGSKGDRLKALLARLNGDLRAGILKSQVTGKPRTVVFLPSLVGRDVNAVGSLTLDIKDKDIDLAQRAFANLADPFKFVQAYEVIFPSQNGLPVVALFNGNQELQDEAPSGQGGVVDDTTVPAPHTHRLQSAISCIRCHGAKADFWQSVSNDVPKIFAPDLAYDPANLNTFIDPTYKQRLQLIGQYKGGGIDLHLSRNRLDFQRKNREAVELGIGSVWEQSKEPGWVDVGRLASEYLGDEYNRYAYGTVSPEDALRDIGIVLADRPGETAEQRGQRATAAFNQTVPVSLLSAVAGIISEDPRIRVLRAGLSLSRQDWSLVRAFVAGSRVKRRAA
jgi:hypothetical protein